MTASPGEERPWTLLTERSVQGIVGDPEAAGYIAVKKVGRRNTYRVRRGRPFRHPAEANHTVGELIDVFLADS